MPLSQQERDRALAELQASRQALLDAVAGLSSAQWEFKPASDGWSIAECVAHIALTEDYYFDLIGKVLSSPPQPENRNAAQGRDDEVIEIMRDRTSKRITWQTLDPSGRWPTPQAAIDHFENSRARLVSFVRTTDAALRDHFEAHRAAGLIDAFQWILLACAHVLRHTDQIVEVLHQSTKTGEVQAYLSPSSQTRT